MHGELALKGDRMTGLRVKLLSDNGAFFADAQPSKFKAGLFHIVTGSDDKPAPDAEADGARPQKAPRGRPCPRPLRRTDAWYLVERLIHELGDQLGPDPPPI